MEINSSRNISNKIHDKKYYRPIILGNVQELLSSTIVDASIGFFSMDNTPIFTGMDWDVIKNAFYHHSGVILEMSNKKLVLLEYGAFPHENDDDANYCYPLGNGFRYSLVDFDYLYEAIYEKNTLFLIDN